jgi:hypothetical protein
MGKEDELAEQIISGYFSRIGRKGAKSRNERLSDAQRKEIATKASKAAAKARTRKAKERKAVQSGRKSSR